MKRLWEHVKYRVLMRRAARDIKRGKATVYTEGTNVYGFTDDPPDA